jgi:hypothetical protein
MWEAAISLTESWKNYDIKQAIGKYIYDQGKKLQLNTMQTA